MFDHVTIRASDRESSERFYETLLAAIGIARSDGHEDFPEWDDFSLAPATEDRAPTRRLHVGFAAGSRSDVDAFWKAGVDAGYRTDGPPGQRPEYSPAYYGAFLLDPDGNSVEAVVHEGTGERTGIDHLWMRVADLPAARRFYELVAPFAGYERRTDTNERVAFRGEGGTLSILPGAATQNVHLAFPATENAVVDAFHEATTNAGFRDAGAPGERPIYHSGYYGAFVLDPDGNNVEVVNHNRVQ